MDENIFRTMLFAVGSLPFWTGERKLKQFLRGNPGSFWEGPEPLKPTYLSHYFFGGLKEHDDGEITRGLQRLKRSGYLKKDRLSPSLPHQVIKLTGDGVFKYYNLLVTERDLDTPVWWIHHIAQLERKPKRPIRTGGEILRFTEDPHLTQTPGFVDQESRIKDEGTIRLIGDVSPIREVETGQSVQLDRVMPRVDDGLVLVMGDPTEVSTVPASDLRRRLTHFKTSHQEPGREDPYMLKGTLAEIRQLERENALSLALEKEGNSVSLRIPRELIDPEIDLSEGNEYVLGPVKRREGEGEQLTLKQSGEIQPHEPFSSQ
jgi:hypothetical protein